MRWVIIYVLSTFFISAVTASEYLQRYQLVLPCFPTAAWVAMVHDNNFKLVDTRVDDDGDTWIIWETAGGVWRGTITISNGATTCVLGGQSKTKPGKHSSNYGLPDYPL